MEITSEGDMHDALVAVPTHMDDETVWEAYPERLPGCIFQAGSAGDAIDGAREAVPDYLDCLEEAVGIRSTENEVGGWVASLEPVGLPGVVASGPSRLEAVADLMEMYRNLKERGVDVPTPNP